MEVLELILIGVGVGFISGFFGIGGGTLVVPLMLLLGNDIKYAVGVSVLQMLFSSIFGSWINFKHSMLNVKSSLVLGLGGFVGASTSGFIITSLSPQALLIISFFIQAFSIYKLVKKPVVVTGKARESHILVFIIGSLVGMVSISVGIGGAALLIPVLMNVLNFDIKKAVSTGLFFVIFSSTAGFISLALHDLVYYREGTLIGLGSLVGVYFGVLQAKKIDKNKQKVLLLILSFVILAIIAQKLFLG